MQDKFNEVIKNIDCASDILSGLINEKTALGIYQASIHLFEGVAWIKKAAEEQNHGS